MTAFVLGMSPSIEMMWPRPKRLCSMVMPTARLPGSEGTKSSPAEGADERGESDREPGCEPNREPGWEPDCEPNREPDREPDCEPNREPACEPLPKLSEERPEVAPKKEASALLPEERASVLPKERAEVLLKDRVPKPPLSRLPRSKLPELEKPASSGKDRARKTGLISLKKRLGRLFSMFAQRMRVWE